MKPMLRFSAKLREAWCDDWTNAVIVKVYGRTVGYFHLVNRLTSLWKPSCEVDFLDVGHGFYVVKFQAREEAIRVMSSGPYTIAGVSVMMRKWSPLFVPVEATLNKVITWIRISGLPLEYYNDDGLFANTSCVGIPIRVDRQTSLVTRGKFARVCWRLT
ncbi:hypothetical protein LINGRAHAP2_LOCUS10201 [Linum grandiflorum]